MKIARGDMGGRTLWLLCMRPLPAALISPSAPRPAVVAVRFFMGLPLLAPGPALRLVAMFFRKTPIVYVLKRYGINAEKCVRQATTGTE